MITETRPREPSRHRASRALERVRSRLPFFGWMATAGMGTVAMSQALGFSWIPLLWSAQAFTPYLLAPAVPVAVVAFARRRWILGAVHTGLACCLLVLSIPVLTADREPVPTSATRVTVAHGNVFYRTDRPADVAAAMLDTGADVLAMTEYSQPVDDALDALDAGYPYVVADAPGDRNGLAMWSRYPIIDQQIVSLGRSRALDATLDVSGSSVRLLVVHPFPGMSRSTLDDWADDMAAIRELADPEAPGTPTVILGDFNATRWHPAMRDLLGDGWRSAHEMLGAGWSRSWPNNRPGPTLVRIDHALASDHVIPTAVRDMDLPGSDHLGFVVELALTR